MELPKMKVPKPQTDVVPLEVFEDMPCEKLYWKSSDVKPEPEQLVLVYFGDIGFEKPFALGEYDPDGDVLKHIKSRSRFHFDKVEKWTYIDEPTNSTDIDFTDPGECPWIKPCSKKRHSLFDYLFTSKRSYGTSELLLEGLAAGFGKQLCKQIAESSNDSKDKKREEK